MVNSSPVSYDRLLGNRLIILQPLAGYRFAIDSVLLAAACPAAEGSRVLDLGSGTGAASLCLAARLAYASITGVENQEPYLKLAEESARRNGLADRIGFVKGDLCALPPPFALQAFDHVIANPPFFDKTRYSAAADPGKTAAHAFAAGQTVGHWIGAARRAVKARGTMTLILAASQLPEALHSLEAASFGGIELTPLWPRRGQPAKRIIISARDQSRASMTLEAGMTLHESDGSYTASARAILEDGKSLAQALRLRDK